MWFKSILNRIRLTRIYMFRLAIELVQKREFKLTTSGMVHYHLAGKVTSEEYAICERLLGMMVCNMLTHLSSNCDSLCAQTSFV